MRLPTDPPSITGVTWNTVIVRLKAPLGQIGPGNISHEITTVELFDNLRAQQLLTGIGVLEAKIITIRLWLSPNVADERFGINNYTATFYHPDEKSALATLSDSPSKLAFARLGYHYPQSLTTHPFNSNETSSILCKAAGGVLSTAEVYFTINWRAAGEPAPA